MSEQRKTMGEYKMSIISKEEFEMINDKKIKLDILFNMMMDKKKTKTKKEDELNDSIYP